MGATQLGAVSQDSVITNTPLSSLVTAANMTSNFYGPTNNPLPIGYTGNIIFLWQNFNTQPVTGTVTIQLAPA
jgi:hypothetical protein